MPVLIPIIAAIVAAVAEAGTALATIAGVVLMLLRIYTILSVIVAAFWAALAYFAKDLFSWFLDVVLSLVAKATEYAGIGDQVAELFRLIDMLPQSVQDLWAVLDFWGDMQMLFVAYAINMALRSLPLVGGLFKG